MGNRILCTVSNSILPEDIEQNIQNMETWSGLLGYFDVIHVICRSYDQRDHHTSHPTKPIVVHYISRGRIPGWRYLVGFLKMMRCIRSIDSRDTVSVVNASEPTTGGMVCTLMRWLRRKKYVLEVQGEMVNLSPKTLGWVKVRAIRWSTLFAAKYADCIRAVSSTVRQQLVDAGVADKKVFVVEGRVKLDDFNYSKYQNVRDKVRTEFDLKPCEDLFMFVGRLVVFKGVRYLIDALVQLGDLSYKLVIIGDGPLRNELEKKVRMLGLQSRVRFYGACPYDKVPYYLSAADLFILPSLDEGFGRAVVEAMALKVPVIASRVGGIKDIIEDGKNGYFFEPANPESIVQTVRRFYSEGKRKQLIESAYDKIIARYEYGAAMSRYIAMYRKVLGGDGCCGEKSGELDPHHRINNS